jgi:hypothetical protein
MPRICFVVDEVSIQLIGQADVFGAERRCVADDTVAILTSHEEERPRTR